MQSPFLEMRGRIDLLEKNLEEMSEEFKRISHPDFNAMEMPDVTGFSRSAGTPKQFFQILQVDAPEAEATYQLTAVGFCLRLMETANRLIELQNRYIKEAPAEEWTGIDETIKKDSNKFLSLLDNSGELRRAREDIYPVLRIDVESYLKEYRRLVENFEDAQAGNVRWVFQYATKPEDVVPMIFDERFSALADSISTVELLEERIQGDMADYAMIRIARDEGIIGDSPFLLKIQQEKEDLCKHRLPRALAMVNMLDKFMTDLQEMGTDTLSHDEHFTVERYKPVSIDILPKITP